jgi:hypothetical protein
MTMSFEVENGIFLIRVEGIIKLADLPPLATAMSDYYGAPDCPGLSLCDATDLRVIAPDAFEMLVKRLRMDNPHLNRSAFVVGEGLAGLQLSRILRDAPSEKRRTFTSLEQARAWLLDLSHPS